ncbi:MAG TPA: DUF427 domain-containing protein [Candidatus Limnocylindrales bacterium]|nr:DUF427 domain-containing protein [Candidatus Limnocylindrales bacterium]
MKAIWNGHIIAEAERDELIFIERNWYFPPERVNIDILEPSDTPYTCPWKGECQYFNVTDGDKTSEDSAFSYPEPLPSAIERVKQDFSGYIAFWRDIEVRE